MSEQEHSLLEEISQLKRELEDAYALIAEKQADLTLAAELGNTLLENNGQIQGEFDKVSAEFTENVEKLEQTNYNLQVKLNDLSSEYSNRFQELEKEMAEMSSTKADLERENKQLKESKVKLVNDMSLEMLNLEHKNNDLQNLFSQSLLETKNLKESVNEYKGLLKSSERDSSREREEKGSSPSKNSEIQAYRKNLQQIQAELEEKSHSHHMISQELESVKLAKQRSDEHVEDLYVSLEEQRTCVIQLKAELEEASVLKANALQVQHKSLLGEVEDKRKELETNLISLRIKYSSLQRNYEISQQQQRRLKSQMACLLQMNNKTNDQGRHQQLSETLASTQNELQILKTRYSCLSQKYESAQSELAKILKTTHESTGFNDATKAHYLDYLEHDILQKTELIHQLKSDLEANSFLLSAEKLRFKDLQKQSLQKDAKYDRLFAENMQLKLNLQGILLKNKHSSIEKQDGSKETVKECVPTNKTHLVFSTEKNQNAVETAKISSEAVKMSQHSPHDPSIEEEEKQALTKSAALCLVAPDEQSFAPEPTKRNCEWVQDESEKENIDDGKKVFKKDETLMENQSTRIGNITNTNHLSPTLSKISTKKSQMGRMHTSARIPPETTTNKVIHIKSDQPHECTQQ